MLINSLAQDRENMHLSTIIILQCDVFPIEVVHSTLKTLKGGNLQIDFAW